jgi:UDPglucose 6-dehydrogenase
MEVLPNHPLEDDQFYINAETGLVVHNCHPRDNIALQYLAEELDLGYDLFDAIMSAREIQAKNLAYCIDDHAFEAALPIYIHGKAYKPNVSYVEGSYSLLIGHYLNDMGHRVTYIDPLTEKTNPEEVCGVILLAHNEQVTYGYTGQSNEQRLYTKIASGSIVIDPWRRYTTQDPTIKVIHYGNTRIS